MLRTVLKRFQQPAPPPPVHRIPEGQRIYAIGDIHGRLDCLDRLLAQIDTDDAAREQSNRALVFLGDLVDRGPQSAQVIDRLIEVKQAHPDTRFLTGNHEEIMLLALDGDREAIKLFDRIGGHQTMLSYGLSEQQISSADFDELSALFSSAVPQSHRAFLNSFEDMVIIGDYAFVHAGVNPSRGLYDQRSSDLRWIRRQFLQHRDQFEKMVVHGHTISDDYERTQNRIGIDTGAFSSGVLTAIGLEGDDQWFLQTERDSPVASH